MSNKRVDFIITTFMREECLANLMRSIRAHGYDNQVIIGDQSEKPYAHRYADENTKVIFLPTDCGLSYARNQLVLASNADYVLLLEDDFEFTPETDISKFQRIFSAEPWVGVVGGMVKQNDVPIHFEFNPVIRDGTLYHSKHLYPYKEFNGVKYRKTGCVLNFALFNKDVFSTIAWDNDLKLREHQDFYIRLKQTKWNVLYTPDVVIKDAKPRHSDEYRALKSRDEFLVKMMEKHGINRIKYRNGTVRELVDGQIFKSKEGPLW